LIVNANQTSRSNESATNQPDRGRFFRPSRGQVDTERLLPDRTRQKNRSAQASVKQPNLNRSRYGRPKFFSRDASNVSRTAFTADRDLGKKDSCGLKKARSVHLVAGPPELTVADRPDGIGF